MDKQKAADLLDNLIGFVGDSQGSGYDTALKMGIKALQGDPDTGDMISRQAAIEAMAKLQSRASTKGVMIGISRAWKAIRYLPSAQPDLSEYSDKLWKSAYERGKAEAQRMRGRWIKDGQHIICDQCGEENDYAYDDRTGKLSDYFCPHCGADMRGEQDETD